MNLFINIPVSILLTGLQCEAQRILRAGGLAINFAWCGPFYPLHRTPHAFCCRLALCRPESSRKFRFMAHFGPN